MTFQKNTFNASGHPSRFATTVSILLGLSPTRFGGCYSFDAFPLEARLGQLVNKREWPPGTREQLAPPLLP